MKRIIYKSLTWLSVAGGVAGLQSCGDWLDINTNEFAATEVDPGYLFAYAALNYIMKRCGGDQFITLMYAAQTASEQTQWFNYIYGGEPYAIDSEYSSGNAWVGTYSSTGYNLQRAIGFAQEKGHVNAEAQCKILTANVFWETTMLFGDIPYSEAWQIDEIKEPKFDAQKDVLYAMVDLLDEALGQIDESDPNTISKYDLYYKGDMAKWRKLAKSLKFKVYMYLANKEDVNAEIKALIEEGDLLASSDDDFQFPFFDSPGNRNPNAEFDNQNPDLLGWMYFGTPEIVDPMNATNDPRLPFYFYPNADGEYVGIASTHEGSAMEAEEPSEITEARFNLETLFKSEYPDVICSYPEIMYYVAEAYVRGLGVTKDLSTADSYFKKGLLASCTHIGVGTDEATTFVDRFPALSTLGSDEEAIKSIATQQRIEMMMRPLEAWSEQRRTGYPQLTVPEMIQSFYTELISRWPYPSRESLVNSNVPQIEGVWTKMWFQK